MIPVLVAAALFGAAVPLSKIMLRGWDEVPLAGTLYLASGIGLQVGRLFHKAGAPLCRGDLPWLAGAVLFGGIAAPVALLYGIRFTTGYAGSLLVNLEAVFTGALAVSLFGERLSRRDLVALAVLILGACAVGFASSGSGEGPRPVLGAALVALACLFWGFDNNFTQRISGRDPLQIAGVKGLAAGATNLGIGLAIGQHFSLEPGSLAGAALIGLFSYGVSLALFVLGLRKLGAARTAALFATAPLSGVLLSWLILGESPRSLALIGGGIMIAGVIWLSLGAPKDRVHADRSIPG
jgi:drug/metabolite transporter (DMT)-like permease